MLDYLAAIKDPSKISDEHITKAYEELKQYCQEHDKDVMEVINDDENIKPAAVEIHGKLPWVVRKMISADKIEQLIVDNLDFIREKASEQYKLENKKNKVKTKKKA